MSADSDSASGPAKVALAISIIALLAAVGALAVAGRRRAWEPASDVGGRATTGGGAQDW